MPVIPKVPVRRALATTGLAAALVLGVGLGASAAPTLTSIAKASLSSGGTQGDGSNWMTGQAVSADGRYIVFASESTTLVTGDTNGASDIFLRDTVAGTTVRVSEAPGGVEANGTNTEAVISADGAWVAFSSFANNLVAGDTNGLLDIYLYEVATGAIALISVDSAGVQGNSTSTTPSISSDGRYIAFPSLSNNLIASDTNGTYDVFVRDRVNGTTTRVSIADDESEANGQSSDPAVSADGAYVAFTSFATNLVGAGSDTNGSGDVFRRDIAGGTTVRVSVPTGGGQANSNSAVDAGGISSNGSRIVFTSTATNLGPDVDFDDDVFVRDMTAATTTLVSVATDGTTGDLFAEKGVISADGRVVAFTSYSTNVVPGYSTGFGDVYLHELDTAETTIVSLGAAGVAGNDSSYSPSMSGDATRVAFVSYASNLVAGDTNGFDDTFLSTLTYPTPVGGGGGSSGGALLPPTGPDAVAAALAGTLATGLIVVGVVAIAVAGRRPAGRHASR